MKLLGDWLREVASREGDRDAFVWFPPGRAPREPRRMTYADWDRRSDAIAAGLASLGLGRGDVLALLLPPRPEYALCYLAAARIGVVTTGVNPRFGEAEIDFILRAAGARVAVVIGAHGGRDLAALVRRVGARLPALGHVFVVDDEDGAGPPRTAAARDCPRDPAVHVPGTAPFSALEGRAAGAPPPRPELSPEDVAAIVWTSGTTGRPKGATFTFAALDAIRGLRGEMLQEHGERSLATGTPFSHVGFMSKIAANVAGAQTTILLDSFKARTVLETIEAERASYVGGVPAQYALLLMDPEIGRFDLSSLRVGAIGGAPFTPELVRSVRDRLGIALVTRYSCTETAVGTGSRPDDDEERLATTVGRPSGIVELRIVDDARRPLPVGEVGEVAIRSPAVMRGYWNDPEATAAAFDADGFYHTGDLGVLDADGYLRVTGRLKDVVVRKGEKISAREIEDLLAGWPGLVEAAIVPVSDPETGERACACLLMRDGSPHPRLDDVVSFLRAARLATQKLPERLRVLESFPRTPSGKVNKRLLREIVESGPDRA